MSRIANRYSKSLFQLALAQNNFDLVYQDMQFILKLISKSVELKNMLSNPLIPSRIKGEMFDKLFKDSVEDLTINFLHFICKKRRTNLLPDMILRFEEYVHSYKGIITAEIMSAQLLSDDQLLKIRDQIADKMGKTIEIKHSVNKKLIGGFIVRIKDTIIDLSVNGQLKKLKEKMVVG